MITMPVKTQTTLAAMLGIVIIEIVAIQKGMNGAMMLTSLALLCGLAGYHIGKPDKDPD